VNANEPAFPTWAVEVRGLEKSFGEHRALRGIDLEVGRGECLVIFGPNGAGKTTLLKIISTLLKPSAGKVLLDGIDIRDKPTEIRRKLSLVSHQTFLYDDLTIFENLKFYGKMYDITDTEKRIREVIAWAQLESRLHDRVGTLSRGLQQRASLARAVLHNPSFLFLDEPEVGLDPHASDMVRDVLSDSGNRTVVITTHNLERGLKLGDKIAIVDKGKIVYRVSSQELTGVNFRDIYDRYTETGR
jgi:ABC-type multidrug transport system ATPase subunit